MITAYFNGDSTANTKEKFYLMKNKKEKQMPKDFIKWKSIKSDL